jgi:hypothetical protein
MPYLLVVTAALPPSWLVAEQDIARPEGPGLQQRQADPVGGGPEQRLAAGHREPEHTHRDPSVMIVDGPARIRYHQGDTLSFSSQEDTATAGTRASWMDPEGPHSVENVDNHPYHAIRVELRPHGGARLPQ